MQIDDKIRAAVRAGGDAAEKAFNDLRENLETQIDGVEAELAGKRRELSSALSAKHGIRLGHAIAGGFALLVFGIGVGMAIHSNL